MSLDLTFLRPLWLLVLPLVAAFGWWLWHREGALGGWTGALGADRIAALRALGRVDPGTGRARPVALPVAIALIVLGLAGPSVERRDRAAFRNLDAVMLVVDASPSLAGGPAWPGIQATGQAVLASLGSRPAGIVVFAGDAYVATDITAEQRELSQTLTLIDADTVPDPGSRPERGLALAAGMLAEAQVLSADVVVMTDTGGAPVLDRLARLPAGTRVAVVAPELTPEIHAMARAAGGAAFAAGAPRDLVRWLAEGRPGALVRQDYPLLFRTDLGRWLIALALAALLLAFPRRPA